MIGGSFPDPCLLTLGHGYTARALAARLDPEWRVVGTVRARAACDDLRAEHVAPLLWDNREAVEEAVGAATHLLISAAPDAEGCPVLARFRAAFERAERLRWVGYLSTTAVYGDRGGDWVDENSELRPSSRRGHWRVAAEEAWFQLGERTGLPVHVFRLAGIYGPGRSAFDKLRDGRARRIIKPGQVFSRIHVADIASVLLASMAKPDPGQAYNVADDEPAPPQDVIVHAAGLLGVEPPPEEPFETAEMTPMARSFYGENKRVSNERIKTDLGVVLTYPNYRAGLAAILAAGG